MNIQNNRAAEVLYSTTYVEDYLDAVENLPEEVQRLLSRLTLLDAQGQTHFGQVRDYFDRLVRLKQKYPRNEEDEREMSLIYTNITATLIRTQEIGDEKIQVAQQIQDFVDNRLRQLEVDRKTLDSVQKQADAVEAAAASTFSARERDTTNHRSSSNDASITDRAVKRVRRVRLGPSIIPNPSPTVTSHTVSSTNDRRSEAGSVSGASTTALSSTSTISVLTASAPEKEKPKEKAKGELARTSSSGSSGQESRKESTASIPAKKRMTETESPQASAADASTIERKTSEHGLRTPKKKEKKITSIQKQPERKASSGSTSSTTKRTASKRKIQQDGGPTAGADPDEATYCVCVQISYGDMIACDNNLCPIEWFHFSCVQLTAKPKGKWYCPTCRDGNANVMKPKEVILKELDQYNREKEGR